VLTASDALLGIALPAVVTAVLLLLGRLAGGRSGSSALALGCGYLAGHVGVRGWRGWQPREASDWILAGAAAGLVVGVLGLTRRGPAWARLALRWVLASAAAWCVAGRAARRDGAGAVLTELIAFGVAAGWSLLEARGGATGEAPSALPPLALCLVASCAALSIGLSGTLVLARLAGALAAALGAAVAGSRLRLAPSLLPGAAPVIVLALGGLLLAAVMHSKLPPGCAVLLSAAALAVPSGGAAGRGRAAGLVALSLCAVLGVAAVGLAYASSPPLDV